MGVEQDELNVLSLNPNQCRVPKPYSHGAASSLEAASPELCHACSASEGEAGTALGEKLWGSLFA